MKAVGFKHSLPIENPESILDFDAPAPVPAPRDLLVEVRAVSVDPVDAKVRGARHQGTAPTAPTGTPRFLGWDSAGVVKSQIILGHELSGIVSALGAGVGGVAEGDPVFGMNDRFRHDAQAEYCVAKASGVAATQLEGRAPLIGQFRRP